MTLLHVPLGGFEFTSADPAGVANFQAMLLDDGTLHPVPPHARPDHVQREVRWTQEVTTEPPAPDRPYVPFPSGPERQARWKLDTNGTIASGLTEFGHEDADTLRTITAVSVGRRFDGTVPAPDPGHSIQQTVHRVYFKALLRDGVGTLRTPEAYCTAQIVTARLADATPNPDGSWHLSRYQDDQVVLGLTTGEYPHTGTTPQATPPLTLWVSWQEGDPTYTARSWRGLSTHSNIPAGYGKTVPANTPWDANGIYQTITLSAPVDWLMDEWVEPRPPGPFGPAVRFRGPGVTWTWAHDAEQPTLEAYGVTLTGGTWAALRDTPVWVPAQAQPDGTVTPAHWDYSPALVLHEAGDVITAIRPDGGTQTCTRTVFEREVLRVLPGQFVRFGTTGQTHHSWPPHWGLADCHAGVRALTAWDPWRDAIKGQPDPDLPAHWFWPARPAKRPARLPPTAPVAPLGVTLADVLGTAVHDDPHPRGQGPYDLPIRVEVWDETRQAYVERPGALAALARRVLYPPSAWPDEPPRGSVGGRLRVTFPPAPPAGGRQRETVLIARYKGPDPNEPGPPPTDRRARINGVALPWVRNGHNADRTRGAHPYVIPAPTANVYELTLTGTLSRLLRCTRTGTPGDTGGGET